ncbi:MAG: signal peptidase II [Acidimicrobiales bacterium]|nr:signal peptidase II [Acidimicrobiales bacterium]
MRRTQDLNVRQQSPVRVTGTVASIVLSILILDQFTKWWALQNLGDGGCAEDGACIDLFWTLRLHLIFNPGASFGTGESLGPVIGVVSFLMAGFMIWLATRTKGPSGQNVWLPRVIYASIAGGALGNGLDRLFRADDGFMTGKVVDFIDFQWWPVFNVADMAIVLAVLGAIARSIFAEDPKPASSDPILPDQQAER